MLSQHRSLVFLPILFSDEIIIKAKHARFVNVTFFVLYPIMQTYSIVFICFYLCSQFSLRKHEIIFSFFFFHKFLFFFCTSSHYISFSYGYNDRELRKYFYFLFIYRLIIFLFLHVQFLSVIYTFHLHLIFQTRICVS